jgi:hypothetical protein
MTKREAVRVELLALRNLIHQATYHPVIEQWALKFLFNQLWGFATQDHVSNLADEPLARRRALRSPNVERRVI